MSKIRAIRCEVFSRVCGYYRPVQDWNDGKQEEFRQRRPVHEGDLADAVRDIAAAVQTDRERTDAGAAVDALESSLAPPEFGV